MAEFPIAFEITGGHEGGYSNHPKDAGGETYKGIARKKHPKWKGWEIIDGLKWQKTFPNCLIGNTTLRNLHQGFFKEQFWDRLSLDFVQDQRIANELYDTGVNCGIDVAGSFLQRSLNICNKEATEYPNLIVDAQIGPKTIAVLNAHKRPGEVLKTLNILQGNKYIDICEARESQEAFYSGWLKRVAV